MKKKQNQESSGWGMGRKGQFYEFDTYFEVIKQNMLQKLFLFILYHK